MTAMFTLPSARAAEPNDTPQVQAIGALLADEIRHERGGAVYLAEREHDEAGPAEGPIHVIVGCLDDQIVGFVRIRIETLTAEVRIGHVLDYGVLPQARGVGVGEEMLNAATVYCREQQCTGMDAPALPGARETKNFFETFGFTARKLIVHRSLQTD